MSSINSSNTITARTISALSVAGLVLALAPAAAGPAVAQGGPNLTATALTPKPRIVRDHRAKPVVRDHRNQVRDHTGGKVPGTAKKKTPCLGNLCNVKVCGGSICF